jgi:hypothetical protein
VRFLRKPIDSLAAVTVAFFAIDQRQRCRSSWPGEHVTHDARLTAAWSAGIIVVCYPLARRLYERDRQH